MNKKPLYWICAILMAVSFGFSIYNRMTFVPVDGQITRMLLVDVFAASPLLYASLGCVCGLRLFSAYESERNRKISLWGSIIFLVLLAGVSVAAILDVPFTIGFFAMIRQLFRSPLTFMAPGIFLGLGLRDD